MLRRNSTPPGLTSALALVLLIHVAGWGVSYHFSRASFTEWADFATKAFYLICGVLLVLSQPILERTDGGKVSRRSIWLGVALVVGYVVSSCTLMVFRAGQAPYLAASVIPPLAVPQMVVASAAEELIFTVFLYSTLRHRFSFAVAALLVALVFTVMHAPTNVVAFGMRFIYMLGACTLFESFRSIAAAAAFHILLNGSLLLVMVLLGDGSSPVFRYPGATFTLATVAMITTMLSASMLIKNLPRANAARVTGMPA